MAGDKAAKERFVQGLTGTNLTEISIIATIPIVLLLLYQLLCTNKIWRRYLGSFYGQFCVLVVPIVVLLMGPLTPSVVLVTAVFAVAIILRLLYHSRALQLQSFHIGNFTVRQALSAHRAIIMIATCISILAVDFQAFPRRFAKVEHFGAGLMDAGVGSIVVASAFAQGMNAARRDLPRNTKRTFRGRLIRLAATFVLGISRWMAVELMNYQTHVGEYGVHWNFFMTLAVLLAMTLFIPRYAVGSFTISGLSALMFLGMHEHMLIRHGGLQLIHTEGRGRDWMSANKEGIFSMLGYLALHLGGCACGAALETASRQGNDTILVPLTFAKLALGVGAGQLFANKYLPRISRRACNASYVTWILNLNVWLFGLCTLAMALVPNLPLPALLQATNDSMLPTFLFANLATGVVNMIFDTLHTGDWFARVIVLFYMLIVCSASLAYQRFFSHPRTV